MISKLDYKLLSYIKRIPGQRAESEGLKELVKGCRCDSVGANLMRLEAKGYIRRSGHMNMAYVITEAGEHAMEAYEFLKNYTVNTGLPDYESMYEQMADLAYDLLVVLLHTPDEMWKNGNTDELGQFDEGLVMHQQFIQRAADMLGINLLEPIPGKRQRT